MKTNKDEEKRFMIEETQRLSLAKSWKNRKNRNKKSKGKKRLSALDILQDKIINTEVK